jgi:hypothetical protein
VDEDEFAVNVDSTALPAQTGKESGSSKYDLAPVEGAVHTPEKRQEKDEREDTRLNYCRRFVAQGERVMCCSIMIRGTEQSCFRKHTHPVHFQPASSRPKPTY